MLYITNNHTLKPFSGTADFKQGLFENAVIKQNTENMFIVELGWTVMKN